MLSYRARRLHTISEGAVYYVGPRMCRSYYMSAEARGPCELQLQTKRSRTKSRRQPADIHRPCCPSLTGNRLRFRQAGLNKATTGLQVLSQRRKCEVVQHASRGQDALQRRTG